MKKTITTHEARIASVIANARAKKDAFNPDVRYWLAAGNGEVLAIVRCKWSEKPNLATEMKKLGYSEPSFRNGFVWTKPGDDDVSLPTLTIDEDDEAYIESKIGVYDDIIANPEPWVGTSYDTAEETDSDETDDETDGDKQPKGISINNGRSYCTPEEAVEAVGMDEIASMMDEEVREELANEWQGDEDDYAGFIAEYLKRAPEDLIIG